MNNKLKELKKVSDKTKKAIEEFRIEKEKKLERKLMILIAPNKARKLTRKYWKKIDEFEIEAKKDKKIYNKT